MTVIRFAGRFLIKAAPWRGCSLTEEGHQRLAIWHSGTCAVASASPQKWPPSRWSPAGSPPEGHSRTGHSSEWQKHQSEKHIMPNYRMILKLNGFSPPGRFLPKWRPASYSSWVWRSSAWPRGGLYPSSDCPPYPPPLDWHLWGNYRYYILGIWDPREAVQKSSVLILPSRFALSPAGSSKLQPLRDAPSALVQSIFTPCKLAPWKNVCTKKQFSVTDGLEE